tara:strand:+ start:18334 stop:20652 length:2319 start_codon:yes stop_codon:yes gene_type:complete
MAINTTTRQTTAFTSGNNFAFAFKVYEVGDVKVIQIQTSNGAETVLTITTNYTVTLNDDQDGNPGGTVTLVSSGSAQNLASGYNIVITSKVSALQQTEITNQGGFFPEVINDVFDKAVILDQQQQSVIDKTIRFPLTQTVGGLEITENAATRANKTLVFDGSGDLSVSATVDGRDVSADGTKLDTIETNAKDDQTAAEIRTLVESASDSNVFTDADHSKLNSIAANASDDQTASEIKTLIASSPLDASHLAADSVNTSEIADDAVTNAKIADAELKTLAGMQSGTASKLADSTALTSDIADLNQIDGLTKQTTISDSDASFPTSGAVVDYVTGQLDDVGGFESIANEVSFPNTQAPNGVSVSIADAAGLVVNGSGVSTTGRTLNGTTVTINNIPSNFHSSTVATGIRFIVTSTGSGQVYNYHKATLAESDLVSLSGDINDFAERYRVGSSNPSSNNDAGDLFFNTSTGKLMVYNGTSSAWEEAQSVGNFFISTLSPAFDGTTTDFTITNAPTNAQQILLIIEGVIQKPNSGTSTPTEGFALSSSTVKLAAAPAVGASYHAVVMGSTVNIGTPSDNTVTTAILQNNSVSTGKIQNEAITLAKLEHGTSSNNGKFLRANNGADPTFETLDLTALSASNLTSGTVPDARFPATLPAASGANLTNLPAANITGTLPAISGANLTNLPASNLTGTVADARISTLTASKLTGALPAIDGSSLTGVSSQKADGCITENSQTISNNYTMTTNKSGLSAGDITVASGVTVTIPSGSRYVII